jgi:dipeptidyl aminopeptidase/acylaminoacyl peptidase
MSTVAPYGSWRSPLQPADLVAGRVTPAWPLAAADADYWIESRPANSGRSTLVRCPRDGSPVDLTPPAVSVRTLVNEYGGMPYLVVDQMIYYVNYEDQQLYVLPLPAATPQRLTDAAGLRFAEPQLDAARRRLIVICEDHRSGGEPVTLLAAVSLADGSVIPLVGGRDFFAAPRLSPDSRGLLWLAWDHPLMPWDGAELWYAELDAAGQPLNARRLAGGSGDACFQPEWAADGTIHVVAERSGWANHERLTLDGTRTALAPQNAEFSQPLWQVGARCYCVMDDGSLVAAACADGRWRLLQLHPDGRQHLISDQLSEIEQVTGDGRHVLITAGGPQQPLSVFRVTTADSSLTLLRQSMILPCPPEYISVGRPISFPTAGDRLAHGIFYPAHNPDFRAPAGALPPLLVMIHGGPTGAADTALRAGIQFWTTRGISVLDVNYGGSTGYGRAYRERLNLNWGIVDVEDVCAGALALAERGLVDRDRLAITGGSAGGFTVLAALAFRTVFRTGASHYGVADLAGLATDTHKFESRYLDGLVGPYPAAADIYAARAPLNHADRIRCPVIFFQGLDDKVVPPDQTERMAAALQRNGVETRVIFYPAEQHGFRKAENIIRTYREELAWYGAQLGFSPAD